MAVISFKNNMPETAKVLLKRAIASSKVLGSSASKESEKTSIQELSHTNNLIYQTAVHYNLSLCYLKLKNYEQAVNIMSLI